MARAQWDSRGRLVSPRDRPRSTREPLQPQSVGDVFQRIGKIIGLPDSEWRELLGHSARVGATQDLFAANLRLPAIMWQGRWKDARMPARYGERVLAQRGAMAQMVTLQGRR